MSSLFAALGVAVSGLSAQSQAIGNISDNLANSQTTGYKAISTSFSSLVTASSATNNSPGGVTARPNYQNDVQGNLVSTSTTTNLSITGSGLFSVTSATQNSAGETVFTGNNYYTRNGDFTLNKDGYMVNSTGYYLEGYLVTNSTTDTSATTPIQISALLDNPQPTKTITYAANLPASANAYTSTPSTIDVFDALGNTHQTDIIWETTATTNVWKATVSVANGGGTNSNYKATFNVTFNSTAPVGTIDSITGLTSGYYNAAGVQTTDLEIPVASPSTGGASAFLALGASTTEGTGLLVFPGSGTQTVNLNLGTYDAATGLTQYANSSSAVSVSSISQDGLGEGSYSSIGIDGSGVVSINYTNGSTRQIYQVPIAQFNSPDNLQRGSGGVYTATLASGSANLHLAGTNGAGTLTSSSLEASDVDIANEFTTMIMSQQVYSANAKVVTTVNSMLNTIIQAVQ